MPVPPIYVLFCLAVLGLFTVSKVEGWAMGGASPGGPGSGSQSSSGGFAYGGTSGGSHK